MDDYSYNRYDKFGRVYAFGQANLADVAGTDAPAHLNSLHVIITALDKAKAGQQGGSALPAGVLLDALRLDVQNITRTAHAYATDDPAFAALFRPPVAANPAALLTAADTIIGHLIIDPADNAALKTAKTARAGRFTAKGLPADFAQHLVEDRTAIDAARDAEKNANTDGVKNTAAISRLVSDGMKECNFLDAIYHNVYARNREKLTAWLSASHLERATTRRAQATKPPSPPPPPAAGEGK